MNTKVIQVTVIVIVTLVVLGWLRSDGSYDFDLRSILPFLRGEVTLHDWGALALLGLGLWGLGRLRRDPEEDAGTEDEAAEAYEETDADEAPEEANGP